MLASSPTPLLFRGLRLLALFQYLASALGLLFNLGFCLLSLSSTSDLAFITLQTPAPTRGQLRTELFDSLRVSREPHPHYLVAKSSQQRLIYREPNATKRLALAVLGVTNSSLGRSSLALLLFSLLTGRLFYHMLTEVTLATPFTEHNARRIRWLALLIIGIDLYGYLATRLLQILVPAVPLGAGSQETVTRFIVLDPTLDGVGSWKFGSVLLVIAAIYQRGVAMAHEAELTI